MADLFGVNSQVITRHIKHIYSDKELEEKATCSKMEQVSIKGFTINRELVERNYKEFMSVVKDIRLVLPENQEVFKNADTLELVKLFASTWLSIDNYDKEALDLKKLPKHLMYFIIKNHPFADGNKRSGAYAFIWYLNLNQRLDMQKVSPNMLTTLTLLIAESEPKHKEKIVKIIMKLIEIS